MMKSKNENSNLQPHVVICDWGSSHLRAYMVDRNGDTLKEYSSSQGVKVMAGDKSRYREELHHALSDLGMTDDADIRISGMAGSKLGWKETEYCATPVKVEGVASNFLSLEGFPGARLLGGVMHQNDDGSLDVMRGEEVQVFGLLSEFPDASLICLPGTHSKWVQIQNGAIASFKTYMTGDLFHSLSKESIFKEQMDDNTFSKDGFLDGCRLAAEGNSLHDLFKLRSNFVFSKVSGEDFYSYLSGFLITNELLSAGPVSVVYLCGSPLLVSHYALALDHLGIESLAVSAEAATIRGHLSLMSL